MRSALVAINAHYMHTSLALRQLHAFSPESECLEFHINMPARRMLDALIAMEPDVVGFSCYIWNIDMVLRLCRALRAVLPGVVLALGGPEVEFDAAEYLHAHTEIDYVLQGEGEVVWPGLLAALERGDICSAPGVWRRDNGGATRGPTARQTSPEEWRYPYPEGLAGLENRLLYVETSRGCPFDCAYCLSGHARLRMTDAGRAIEFLTRMAADGARIIKLVDRTFNADNDRAIAIWEALKARAGDWPQHPVFHFEITARLLDERALRCLESAPRGLFQLEIGIQSTSERVLEAVERPDDWQRIAYVVRRLEAAGNMHLHVDLIAGLPGETAASFARAFDVAWDMGAERLQLGFLKLLRGSALRDDAAALGLVYDPDPPYEIERTPDMSAAELIRLRRIEELVEAYANSGRYRCTLRLLTLTLAPYALFDALCGFFIARGLFERGLSESDRVAAIYDFALALPGIDPEWLGACLRHDCILRGGRPELPDALAGSLSDADRAALRAYSSPVRGQWIEHYAVDMAGFANDGAPAPGSCALLYDPKKRFWREEEMLT